ncbi:hypothetical protein H0H92_003250 [Tricholoma furcatifolium]|nr:hypothetical protein H0H92_003250 [Tricholoma furcatifolium]
MKSTGKTTLVNALAQKLNLQEPALVKEVAREVMATQGFSRADVGSLKMQQAIQLAQLKRENEGENYPIQISDRSAVDPIVYAVLTSTTDEEAQHRRHTLTNIPEFQLVLEKYRESTFLLLAPVTDWLEDDGIRLVEKQAQCFEVFKSELKALGIDFQVLGPDMRRIEERFVKVLGLLRL